ncbi:DNA polymerase III subunit alpha [Halobacillus rhizosphaerae]|uniref:DNA polymerase III subunit alpha n=1 Tax=Halobacillus rhizosphaerae TaxID=3064889 RepID=UPI00398AFAEC
MSFTHLHVQSSYSLMKSTIKIEPLVQRAKELGYNSLALTDEGVMSGAVSFYKACKQQGVKPILGLKAEVKLESTRSSVLLLARNNTGYENLLKISTTIQMEETVIDLESLHTWSTGLIAIVMPPESSLEGAIAESEENTLLNQLQLCYELFSNENVFLGIQDRPTERRLLNHLKDWGEKEGIQGAALGRVRYLEEDGGQAYQCLRAIDEGNRWSMEHSAAPSDYYLKNGEEMEAAFSEWPEVLQNTGDISRRCEVSLSLDHHLIPSFPVGEAGSSEDYLRRLCEQSLPKKYSSNQPQAWERMNHELQVITSMQFSDYFLIVWDFIDYARRNGIHAGPGRGSAAGSIVAYLLNITQVDPLAYDLLFERFLNPERVTMPDIDIDFPDHRRDEVIEYVANKYGRDHVAQICTFGTFAARSVLRELFKVMEIDDHDAAFILKQVSAVNSTSLVKIVQSSEELKEYIRQSNKLQVLFRIASKLEGLPRHVSTHAAGVVISERSLYSHTALMNGQSNVHLTQLAMGDLESIGLLKMDFLGLRNLTFIERIEKRIKDFKDASFKVEEIPLDDEPAYLLLQEGRTTGVFQLESQGMKSVLRRLKPTRFEDVVAVNALYRPGPMDYIPTYINRKHGKEAIFFPHPDLQPILENTFGVLVYQEQIMQVAQKAAGYTLGQADILRRAVSKKKANVLKEQREQFIAGCKRNGYEPQVGEEVFEWIVKFSNYGFNRSHAVAYSLISYRLAYLKAHYPSYFLAELINAHLGDRDKLAQYIREARDNHVKVKAPSINHSSLLCKDEKGSIRMGLTAVKGVGFQAANAIAEERKQGKFRSLNDFCLRLISKSVTRSVIEALILAGAFDDLQQNRASLLAGIDQALEQGELFKEFQDQPGFFGTDLEFGESKVQVEPFPILKKLAMEKEVLGTYLSEHPLESHRTILRKNGWISLAQADKVTHNKSLQVAAVVETIKEIRTKRGDPMAFVTISDETSEMDTVLFPEVYRSAKPWVKEQMLIQAKGKIEKRNDRKQMLINEFSSFEEELLQQESEQRIFIRVESQSEIETMEYLNQLAKYFPGNTPVLIFRADQRKTYQLDESYSLAISRECLDRLKQFFGASSIAVRARDKTGD